MIESPFSFTPKFLLHKSPENPLLISPAGTVNSMESSNQIDLSTDDSNQQEELTLDQSVIDVVVANIKEVGKDRAKNINMTIIATVKMIEIFMRQTQPNPKPPRFFGFGSSIAHHVQQ